MGQVRGSLPPEPAVVERTRGLVLHRKAAGCLPWLVTRDFLDAAPTGSGLSISPVTTESGCRAARETRWERRGGAGGGVGEIRRLRGRNPSRHQLCSCELYVPKLVERLQFCAPRCSPPKTLVVTTLCLAVSRNSVPEPRPFQSTGVLLPSMVVWGRLLPCAGARRSGGKVRVSPTA